MPIWRLVRHHAYSNVRQIFYAIKNLKDIQAIEIWQRETW